MPEVLDPVQRLVDHPSLADPGFATHDGTPRHARASVGEDVDEHAELCLATDHG
jgi:hypothetical protein